MVYFLRAPILGSMGAFFCSSGVFDGQLQHQYAATLGEDAELIG